MRREWKQSSWAILAAQEDKLNCSRCLKKSAVESLTLNNMYLGYHSWTGFMKSTENAAQGRKEYSGLIKKNPN